MHQLVLPLGMIFLLTSLQATFGQNPLSQQTQVAIGLGFTQPNLRQGAELLRADDLRQQGLSYFADPNGIRQAVGEYPSLAGYNLTIEFFLPVKPVKGLLLGALVKNSQTGSTPAGGGYGEGYFFNFITAGLAAKYYPAAKSNLFIQGNFGLAAVLTKNRYRNSQNEQNFFHQFGIGTSLGLAAGYPVWVNKQRRNAVELVAAYQLANARVEVNGIGDDQWQFGAWSLGVVLNWLR